ncbi:MAG: nucleotidyltransferase domain-containing protein [Bacteroidales bacterium]
MQNFSDHIRTLRLEKQLPLRKVAAYLDIDQAVLSKIERGQRKACRENVIKLAEYYNLDANKLLNSWHSDQLFYQVKDEEEALEILKITEVRILYEQKRKKKRSGNNERKRIIKRINHHLQTIDSISAAWIFGSFAREEDVSGSDIDILIKIVPEKTFTLYDIAEIQHDLQKLVGKKVDLVMQKGIRPEIYDRINHDKILIYEKKQDQQL